MSTALTPENREKLKKISVATISCSSLPLMRSRMPVLMRRRTFTLALSASRAYAP